MPSWTLEKMVVGSGKQKDRRSLGPWMTSWSTAATPVLDPYIRTSASCKTGILINTAGTKRTAEGVMQRHGVLDWQRTWGWDGPGWRVLY
jgi:hypothetical protein